MMKLKRNDIFYKRILMQLINMLGMEQRGGYGRLNKIPDKFIAASRDFASQYNYK